MVCLKKLGLAIVIGMISVFLSGCALVRVNPERDMAQVVARFNGNEILKGEVIDIFDRQKELWGITEEMERDPEARETILSVKKQILDTLIDEKIVENEAIEAGFTVREEDIRKAQEEFNEQLLSYAEFLKEQDEEAEREGVDYEKKAREVFDGELKAMGLTEREYVEMVALSARVQEFRESKLAGVEAAQEQVQEYYNKQLELQKAGQARLDQGDVALMREPAARVKHILIALPDEEQAEYRRLRGEGLNDEAESYLAEKLEAIRPKAQEVLGKARMGENFEELIAAYGEDPGMVDNEEGYTVKRGGGFIPQFEEAALALEEVGQISDLVGGQFGYHIIKLYEKMPGHIYTLEEKREEIEALLDSRMQETEWNSLMETWREEANITRYTERL
jgi:parvulin-like peptidyl-prolyl isomerase